MQCACCNLPLERLADVALPGCLYECGSQAAYHLACAPAACPRCGAIRQAIYVKALLELFGSTGPEGQHLAELRAAAMAAAARNEEMRRMAAEEALAAMTLGRPASTPEGAAELEAAMRDMRAARQEAEAERESLRKARDRLQKERDRVLVRSIERKG